MNGRICVNKVPKNGLSGPFTPRYFIYFAQKASLSCLKRLRF